MILRFILLNAIFCFSSLSYATFPQFDTFTVSQQHAIFEKLYKIVEGKNANNQTIQIGTDLWIMAAKTVVKGSLRKHQDYTYDYNFQNGHDAGLIQFKNIGDQYALRIEDDTYSFEIKKVENLLIKDENIKNK